MPPSPGPGFVGWIKQQALVFPSHGWSHGWCGGGINKNDKITPRRHFWILKWWVRVGGTGHHGGRGRCGRKWEQRCPNPAKCHQTNQLEMSKIAKRDVCKLFCYQFDRLSPRSGQWLFFCGVVNVEMNIGIICFCGESHFLAKYWWCSKKVPTAHVQQVLSWQYLLPPIKLFYILPTSSCPSTQWNWSLSLTLPQQCSASSLLPALLVSQKSPSHSKIPMLLPTL